MKESEPVPEPMPAPIAESKSNLLVERRSCQIEEIGIEQIVEVDSPLMSFGKFISGKVLGSTLLLTNKTQEERSFWVHIESDKA